MPRFDITVAGELNLDLILYGLPDELPPEREFLVDQMMLTPGGSSAIVAHNLAALGSQVGFIARIGDDEFGQIALDHLATGGVDVSKLRRMTGSTKTGLTVILQRDSWRNMVTYAGATLELKFADLDLDYLSSSRHFHLSSFYLQRGLQSHVAKLFRKLKAAGLTISLDTNDDPEDQWEGGIREALRYVDVFLPNEREARRIAGVGDLQSAVNAVDAVGAGDSFDAGFLHQYVRGADLSACLASGNLAGALSTTRPGGTEAFRDRDHRERFFREHGIVGSAP